jgi:hypothetical protein
MGTNTGWHRRVARHWMILPTLITPAVLLSQLTAGVIRALDLRQMKTCQTGEQTQPGATGHVALPRRTPCYHREGMIQTGLWGQIPH